MKVGDIILRIDDTIIRSAKDLADAIAGKTYMQVCNFVEKEIIFAVYQCGI